MKCPKCGFVSFDALKTCKRCNYEFEADESKKKAPAFSKMKSIFGRKDVKEEAVTKEEHKEEAAAVQKEESAEAVKEEAAAIENRFDDQFDNLFGEDKYAEKGTEADSIKLTAVDRYTETQKGTNEMMTKDYDLDESMPDVTDVPEEKAKEPVKEEAVAKPSEEEEHADIAKEYMKKIAGDMDSDADIHIQEEAVAKPELEEEEHADIARDFVEKLAGDMDSDADIHIQGEPSQAPEEEENHADIAKEFVEKLAGGMDSDTDIQVEEDVEESEKKK